MKRLLGLPLVALCAASPGAAAKLQTTTPVVAVAPNGLQDEVFYHIFTRSMRDSNGDDQGDLKGIEQSLPYLKKLGVTSILLTPLYPSPFYHNYFASDFEGIDRAFGTIRDFRSLVRHVHADGMKIFLDEEFQYVSYDHKWFRSALGNPASPYSDFFIFHGPGNSRPESGPFGITMAPRFPAGETGITTINMKSDKFRAWATDYLLGWMDPQHDGDFSDGVDGFRLDHMMDDLDNKHINTNLFASFWRPVIAKLRAANPKIKIIAEQWDWGDGADFLRRGGVDAVFAFPLSTAIRSFDKERIIKAIGEIEKAMPPGKNELLFLENHDTTRIASDPAITPEKLRTAATILLALKGVPSIYYGQELGMKGRTRDEYKSDEKDIGDREAFKWGPNSEAPGQANWYKGPRTYWTQRFARNHDGVSVKEEESQPRSLLTLYRRLIRIRSAHPALRSGTQQVIGAPDGLLAVVRQGSGQRLLLVANLSPMSRDYSVSGIDLLSSRKISGKLHLAPFQATIVEN